MYAAVSGKPAEDHRAGLNIDIPAQAVTSAAGIVANASSVSANGALIAGHTAAIADNAGDVAANATLIADNTSAVVDTAADLTDSVALADYFVVDTSTETITFDAAPFGVEGAMEVASVEVLGTSRFGGDATFDEDTLFVGDVDILGELYTASSVEFESAAFTNADTLLLNWLALF